MLKTLLEAAVVATRRERPFYEAIVLRLLNQFQKGYLRMTLPSGEVMHYGSTDATTKAAIHVRDAAFFRKCVMFGDVGFGESYMEGDWDTDSITNVVAWMILNVENNPAISGSQKAFSPISLLRGLERLAHLLRPNSLRGSRKNIAAHYDLSNDFFRLWLDPSMTYSCAMFDHPEENLQAAQLRKYDALCRKLEIQATDHVLEIGGGWGGFAVYAAKTYGCHVTSLTISQAQFEFAQRRVADEQLESNITVELKDYRHVQGTFDKIVSIEMLEAVGHRYLPLYFQKCHDLLKKEGRLGLQVIICPDTRYHLLRKGVDWIQRHIFPGCLLPSIAAINQAVNRTGDLFLHGLEDMGLNYAATLRRWQESFHHNLEGVRALGFDESFIRKWSYYLCYCEAAFQARNISVVQMVYSRPNNRIQS